MLEELVVENLVLVRSARLSLHPGLNVLTGETGAGKTILAEAVGLLLGGRADASLVGPAASEAYVEATFSDAELPEELTRARARRAPRASPWRAASGREGRSRALLYGRSCTRDDLERIGQSLIEMVSQHEARRLVRPAVQLDLLDASGGDELAGLRARDGRGLARARRARGARSPRPRPARPTSRDAWPSCGRSPTRSRRSIRSRARRTTLARERSRLRHLDVLREAAQEAAELLNPDEGAGAVALAGEAAHALARVREHDAALAGPGDELARIAEELREASRRAALLPDRARRRSRRARPHRGAARAARRAAPALRRRRRGRRPAAARRGGCDRAGRGRARRRAHRARRGRRRRGRDDGRRLAARLHKAPEKAAKPFARGVEGHLADMGMDGARLEVSIAEAPLGARGRDAVELRLAANPGLPAGPLGSVASGGELSRIALAVRLAARDGGATEMLVFDEVDAGIGGRTARVLTDKLRELAATAQVLCITHLPQIAAAADRHFLVEKTQGATSEAHVAELVARRGARGARAHARRRRGGHRRPCARGQPARQPRTPRNPIEGCPRVRGVPMVDLCASSRSGLLAVLLLATAVAATATASPRPPLFQTGRYAALGAGGSLSFVVERSQITRLQVRMPLACQNKRTQRTQRPDARLRRLDGPGSAPTRTRASTCPPTATRTSRSSSTTTAASPRSTSRCSCTAARPREPARLAARRAGARRARASSASTCAPRSR